MSENEIKDMCDFFVWKWEGIYRVEKNKRTESFYEELFESQVSYGRETYIYGFKQENYKLIPVAIYNGEWKTL